jgi:hypothetical protein
VPLACQFILHCSIHSPSIKLPFHQLAILLYLTLTWKIRPPNHHPNQRILKGKYHCTIDLLFDLLGLVCFSNKNKNCQLPYSWFQTSKTRGQQYSDTSPFSIPCPNLDPYHGQTNTDRTKPGPSFETLNVGVHMYAVHYLPNNKTAELTVEYSVQTTSMLSPVSFRTPCS